MDYLVFTPLPCKIYCFEVPRLQKSTPNAPQNKALNDAVAKDTFEHRNWSPLAPTYLPEASKCTSKGGPNQTWNPSWSHSCPKSSPKELPGVHQQPKFSPKASPRLQIPPPRAPQSTQTASQLPNKTGNSNKRSWQGMGCGVFVG